MTAADYLRMADQADQSAAEVRETLPDNEINRRVARFHESTAVYFIAKAKAAEQGA